MKPAGRSRTGTASDAPSDPASDSGSAEPRASRDFFFELVKTSQARPGFLAERERWLRSLVLDGREELLFEFEMLLRGIERSFNLHNLPIDHASRPVVTRDFHPEMEDVRDAIEQAIRLARTLLDPRTDQKLVFRRYVESQLTDDRSRRALFDEQLGEQTPQESLFVLRVSLDALRGVIDHLLKLEVFSFTLFNEVGTLALREIVLNPYFRPFGPLEFRIEYDRIKSVALLEALRALPETERALFTTAVLAVFRILHYLSYVSPSETSSEQEGPPPRARVVLALVRSETVTLINYLRGDVATRAQTKRHQAHALRIARDLARGSEQIVAQHLSATPPGVGGAKSTAAQEADAPLQAAVAFTGLYREALVHLARAVFARFPATLQFNQLIAPVKMADRLRRDLWVLVELCRRAEQLFRESLPEGAPRSAYRGVAGVEAAAASAETAPGEVSDGEARADGALRGLRAYLRDFQDVSYHLLRYGDFEAFDRFTAIVTELPRPPAGPTVRARFAEDLRLFAQVAETTLAGVSRRAHLASKPLDTRDAEQLLARYLAE